MSILASLEKLLADLQALQPVLNALPLSPEIQAALLAVEGILNALKPII